jgi:hypothetical protein
MEILDHFIYENQYAYLADSRSMRATIRLFAQQLNSDAKTGMIFPIVTAPQLGLRLHWDYDLQRYGASLFAGHSRTALENTNDFRFNCSANYTMEPRTVCM